MYRFLEPITLSPPEFIMYNNIRYKIGTATMSLLAHTISTSALLASASSIAAETDFDTITYY